MKATQKKIRQGIKQKVFYIKLDFMFVQFLQADQMQPLVHSFEPTLAT